MPPHQPFPVFKYVTTIKASLLTTFSQLAEQRGLTFAVIPSVETSRCFAGLVDLYGRLNTNDATFINLALQDLQG